MVVGVFLQKVIQKVIAHSRHIHARAGQMPLSERRRKLLRPPSNHQSGGRERVKTRPDSKFLILPAQYGVDTDGRTSKTAQQRKDMQLSATPQELLKHLQSAIQNERFDASVFGAAMQRSGMGRWWDCLMEVRQMQHEAGVSLFPLQRNICLTALTRCVRGERGFGTVPSRQDKILKLGKQVWAEAPVANDVDTFNSGLGAALRLCAVANEPAAMLWADELWLWAKQENFGINPLSYEAFALVLEVHQKEERVNAHLTESRGMWVPSRALLGGLVNAAGERLDWKRAEILWSKLVSEFDIKPTEIQYACRAKAYLLAGQPSKVASVCQEMLDNGFSYLPKIAMMHVQALLIMYHSSLTQPIWKQLESAFKRGDRVFRGKRAAANQRAEWHRSHLLRERLRASPISVPFSEVLVEWKAATQSPMKAWKDCLAGSNYLKLKESSAVI